MPLVHRKHFYIICIFTSTLDLLGMGHYTKTDEFSESFQNGEGGRSFSFQKLIMQILNFKQGLLSMKLIQKSHFSVVLGMLFQQLY